MTPNVKGAYKENISMCTYFKICTAATLNKHGTNISWTSYRGTVSFLLHWYCSHVKHSDIWLKRQRLVNGQYQGSTLWWRLSYIKTITRGLICVGPTLQVGAGLEIIKCGLYIFTKWNHVWMHMCLRLDRVRQSPPVSKAR